MVEPSRSQTSTNVVAPRIAAVAEAFERGERAALARAITLLESEAEGHGELYDRLFARAGRAARYGITGPAGAGKSTLVAGLLRHLRGQGQRVAVVAVDPTSPYTGGALLGDRIRMDEHTLDEGVFIRSMATRGALGGLARHALEAADLCDAFGFDVVLVETVGVGQVEHDIVATADVVAVVLQPGGGDAVQAMKAGLYEIADVFAVNKADQPDADRLESELSQMLDLRRDASRARVPIVRTVATTGDGIDLVWQTLGEVRAELAKDGRLAERQRARREAQLGRLLEELVAVRLRREVASPELRARAGVAPYRTSRELFAKLFPGAAPPRA
jgi:LAO/AO transport system kinase